MFILTIFSYNATSFLFLVTEGETMKVLKKLLFVSVAATGLLLACPHGGNHGGSSGLHAPHGVLNELYETASLKQKREILQIEFDARKAIKSQTEKFRQYMQAIEFDIKNLRLDLEEATMSGNTAKKTEILHRIAKKQEEYRKSKQDERNLMYLLQEDKIKKINGVLKVK